MSNAGARDCQGERISTSVAEATVTQVVRQRFCQQPQRPWTKRAAPRLRQTRVKTLNHALGAVFRRGYPAFPVEKAAEPQAA